MVDYDTKIEIEDGKNNRFYFDRDNPIHREQSRITRKKGELLGKIMSLIT